MPKKKIKKLAISGFRGERYLTKLNFTNTYNSMLIFGANAKGKSSLADAFEWFFTGKIEELGKEGCTRADYRHRLLNEDEETVVAIEFSEKELDSDFTLPASLRQVHSNETKEFKQYLEDSRDELTILRHKDLKQFVDETKSYKRKRIAKLIGMEGWEKIRDDMATAENRLGQLLDQERQRREHREKEVAQQTEVEVFSEKACWEYAEKNAAILGIDYKIRDLDSLWRVDDEAKTATAATERQALLAKLKSAGIVLQELSKKPPQITVFTQFAERHNVFCSSPENVLWAQVSALYKHGKSIIDSGYWDQDVCPLCGLEITRQELAEHIKQHEGRSVEIQRELAQLNDSRASAKKELQGIGDAIEAINDLEIDDLKLIEKLKIAGSVVALKLADAKSFTERKLETGSHIDVDIMEIGTSIAKLLVDVNDTLIEIQGKLTALTPTAAETARIDAFQNLNTLSAHMAALEKMDTQIGPLERQFDSMETFTVGFRYLRRKTMGNVLAAISSDVSRYFLELHPNEGFDHIQLKFLPEVDGVEFHIVYKGEEITPPRKFLSESYLSGLGVCLFLATARVSNKENGFVVLDDIVNSFDSEHRADLARVLINEFKDFQLIVLTHDGVWFDLFRRLTQAGWQYRRINAWSYEDGIDIEQAPQDELDDCKQAIESGKVDYAAPKVRSFMERRLKRLSYELGVRMRFKPGSINEARMTGELFPEIRRHLKHRGFLDNVDNTCFSELEASSFVVNYGSHDRSLSPDAAGLAMGDVEFAFQRMCKLESLFNCQDCRKPIWYVRNQDYKMNCECGRISL